MFGYFTRTHFFHEGSIHLSSKSDFFTYNTCTWGTTFPPYFSLFVFIFVMRYHLVLMFLWSPIDLYCVAASLSRPCLEHPSWVIIAFMESILSPFVSRYSPPFFIAWFVSHVAHHEIQSHCPLSLMILCPLLPGHPCPLCFNKGSRSFATQYPPFHHHHRCQSVSRSTIFSRALVKDPLLPHLWHTSFYRHQIIHSRR